MDKTIKFWVIKNLMKNAKVDENPDQLWKITYSLSGGLVFTFVDLKGETRKVVRKLVG
jgi:hypothetical protein